MTPTITTSEDRREAFAAATRQSLLRDLLLRRLALAALAWLVLYAVGLVLTRPDATSGKLLNDGIYLVPLGLAAAASFVAAIRGPASQRRFWQVLTASNILWLIGECIWTSYVVVDGAAPFPSVADAFYIASYALVPAAVVLGFVRSSRLRILRGLLDASGAAVALGVIGYLLTIEPQLSSSFSLATLTGIAYPLLGLVILVVMVTIGFGGHRLVPVSVALVGIGFAVSAVTDAGYTYASVLHSFVPGQWLNLGWQAEALLLMIAAVAAVRHGEGAARARRFDRDLGLPMVVAGLVLTAALVLVDLGDRRISPLTITAAAYCALTVLARLYLTGRDRERLARELERALVEQERLAVSDGLTGLHNRRFFDELLTLESERSSRQLTDLSLLVLDLDHFKQINDRFGHATGDAVLVEVARRLRSALRSSEIVVRYGGEEFAVILADTGIVEAQALAERIRRTLSGERVHAVGRDITVTASVGVSSMPALADSKEDLLRRADAALYRAKRLGRNQVQLDLADADDLTPALPGSSPVIDYLQNLADEIDSRQGPSSHSAAIADWAVRVAASLSGDRQTRARVVAAARFHDIGKVVVPDSILRKAGSLTAEEWEVIRQHPEQGARLVQLAPEIHDIAEIVAAHHERPDGRGYPHGLSGEQIPLEARIIAVCDAWAAMRADRPYRRALTEEEAIDQLHRGRDTQFDGRVLDAFIPLVLRRGLEMAPLPELARA